MSKALLQIDVLFPNELKEPARMSLEACIGIRKLT